jgi:hypothetical protein
MLPLIESVKAASGGGPKQKLPSLFLTIYLEDEPARVMPSLFGSALMLETS